MGDERIFVFGSNLAGRHGKGAALYARENKGAIYGQAEGLQGNSYAIPTKDANIKTLPLETIALHIKKFLDYAGANRNLQFFVTAIGCGLGGYEYEQIAPYFLNKPSNVWLCTEFADELKRQRDKQRPIPHGAKCSCFFCLNKA